MNPGGKEHEGLIRRDFIKETAGGTVVAMMAGATGIAISAPEAEIKSAAPARSALYESMLAESVSLRGHEGDWINAYLARPMGAGPYPGVVVIHHMPGWDEGTKEIARKFAYHGYVAISPNLHFREGKNTPEENSASVRAAGGMPDNRTMGDVEGAIGHLRALPYHNGKVGIIGYCSGGRQCYLAACTLRGIDAAVPCYPGGVGAGSAGLTERQPVDPIDYTKNLSCPLLGLFGRQDQNPSPEHAAKIEAELKKWGKTYRLQVFENAGHSFFRVDNAAYRPEAAVEGWKMIFEWFGKYLT